jgi:hypothetical protein
LATLVSSQSWGSLGRPQPNLGCLRIISSLPMQRWCYQDKSLYCEGYYQAGCGERLLHLSGCTKPTSQCIGPRQYGVLYQELGGFKTYNRARGGICHDSIEVAVVVASTMHILRNVGNKLGCAEPESLSIVVSKLIILVVTHHLHSAIDEVSRGYLPSRQAFLAWELMHGVFLWC